jgi:hypothetical protein
MPLNRRALIVSATAAGLMAPGALAVPTLPRSTLSSGIWRSRTTAEYLSLDHRACRTYTCYDKVLALVEDLSREDFDREKLNTSLGEDGHLDLEYWGTLTRFQYDRVEGWPDLHRLDGIKWLGDPVMTVSAFFEALSGHFAFAKERGINWAELQEECYASIRSQATSQERLFDSLTWVMSHLEDGHGSLKGLERYEESRPSEALLYRTWKAAGGRAIAGDFSDGFSADWGEHVRNSILSGKGRFAAADTVVWGRLPSGLGYLSLMSCEGLSEEEGGHADVIAANRIFDRALKDLGHSSGLVIDLRFNNGGWDRVALALASHLTDSALTVFTKQPVRRGIGLQVQSIELSPAKGARHTGPVAFLTSDATVSAAEVGALALRALPNTRSFGQPTYGALSDPFQFRLPNGWKGTVSNEVYRDPGGHVFEGTGIPPDQFSTMPDGQDYWGSIRSQLTDAETWLLSL